MTIEITEADKERAAAFAGVWSMYGFAGYMELALIDAFAEHRIAALQAREDVGESAEAVEQAAEMIWHRFAPPTQIEWQDEHEKAPYRDCARGVLSLYTHPTPAELPGDAA